MEKYRVICNGREIANQICLANTFLRRLKGLLGRKNIDDGDGILIYPCNQIHTFGMKFDIDVLFLSIEDNILYIEENFSPGQVSPKISKANKVLELKSGTISKYDIKKDQKLCLL